MASPHCNIMVQVTRGLVAEVAAILPPGIKLEYEGRYAAMFSHEIKNYALLTYNGRLIVHGSGLRSSSSPPFAACFLMDALEYLLRDDVAAVAARGKVNHYDR